MIGLAQLQLPVVVTKADLARQTDRIVYMVGKARRNLGTMELLRDLRICRPIATFTLFVSIYSHTNEKPA